eukprot:s996_g37.t1
MTYTYDDLGLKRHWSVDASPVTMKWSHRALLKDDFTTEWQARDRACELALALNCEDLMAGCADSSFHARSTCTPLAFTKTAPPCVKHLRVGFADSLDLWLGLDDEFQMFKRTLPADSFACGLTPWSRAAVECSSVPTGFSHGQVRPLSFPMTHTIGDLVSGPLNVTSLSTQRHDEWMQTSDCSVDTVPGCVAFTSSAGSEASPHVPIDSPGGSDSPDLHRLEPEPPWAAGIWELLRNDGHIESEVDGEGPVVFVNSFYINHQTHQRHDEPRPMRFDVDFRDWENDIKVVWEDLIENGVPIDVSVVHPDPPHSAFPDTIATIIVHQRQTHDRAAILTTAIHISDPVTRFIVVAHSAPRLTSSHQILQIAQVLEVCQLRASQGFGVCTVLCGHDVVPPDAVLNLDHGLGLQIRIPAPLSEAEQEHNLVIRVAQSRARRSGDSFDPAAPDDDPEATHPRPDYDHVAPEDSTSFMARRPQPLQTATSSISRSRSSSSRSLSTLTSGSSHSSDTPFWRLTVVFSLDGQVRSLRLPWGDRPQMIALVARAFMLYENEIAQLHRVSHRPSDFIQNDLECILLRRQSEVRPNDHMRLVLIDLTVFDRGQVLPTQHRRFVRWVPSTMTRRSTFRLLGLDEQCINPFLDSTLWHNNVIISELAHRPLRFHDDEYIRILIVDPACACPVEDGAVLADDTSLFQTSFSTSLVDASNDAVSIDSLCEAGDLDMMGSNGSSKIVPILHSFTEAFLNALRLFNQAAEDLPDFPSDPEDNLDMHDPWVRSVYDAWNALATIGPGGVERLGRLETWFSDHLNFQRRHFTRIAVLGGDFARWEQELRILWRDHVLPGAALEFHLVEPLPEDAANQIIGQLILVQRPVRFQRSLIISVYDSAYDRGMAHSVAVVMTDRVDLHSVRSVVDAVDDCPPEVAQNVCALWIGSRQMQDHERFIARHGQSFRFLIHRRPTDSFNDMSDLDDPLLRDRIRHLSGLGPLPFPSTLAVLPPGWAQDLHRAFAEYSFVERDDEGPVAYLQTWHLNGVRASRCHHPRTVRLRSDASSWQRSITDLWDDRLDLRLPLDLFWVDPAPLNSPLQSYIGHVLVLQETQHEQAALLLTALRHGDELLEPHHVAVCGRDRLSFSDIVDLFPIPGDLLRMPLMIRREQFLWPARRSVRVNHGDNILIEIQPPALLDHDGHVDDTNAATHLLQTSVHRTARAHAQRPRAFVPAADRVTITLQNLIPAPARTVVDCQKVVYLRNRLLMLDTFAAELGTHDVWWHRATWSELYEMPIWKGETPLGFSLYTDGSACRSRHVAAAGVVLLVHTSSGLRWGGYISALCPHSPTAPYAEASALFLALLWLQQLLRGVSLGSVWCEIAYDCEHTAMIAQGLQAPASHLALHHCVRSLVQWHMTVQQRELYWTHHRSHQRHPWNEAADTVCRHAQRSGQGTTQLEPLIDLCTFQSQDHCPIQWLWLLERSLQGHPEAPLLCGHHWHFDVGSPFASQPDATLHPAHCRQREVDSATNDCPTFGLRFATANVLTLFPESITGACFISARAEELAAQFLTADLHLVGLQETRARFSGHRHTDAFHVLSAAATARGQGGVQLWVRKRLTCGTHTIDVDIHDLKILHATSRRLLVRFAHPSVRLLVFVLHAPSDDDEDVLQAYWDATSSTIPAAYRTWNLVVLADANSRVGSVTSSAIQDFAPEEENGKGALFHSWLLHHHLFLPQTFECCHSGSSSTWTHPKGSHARLDYIAVSSNFPVSAISTWIEDEVDLTLTRADHRCVCLRLDLPFVAADRRRRSERLRKSVPCSTGAVSWLTDVHTHAAYLHGWLLEQQKPHRIWRKPHLSDSTKILIDAKKFHRRKLRACQQHCRLATLRLLFSAWRLHQVARDDFRPWLQLCDHTIAWHQWAYHDVAGRVVQAVRADDKNFYDDLAASAGDATAHGCQAVWAAIQHALPRWRSKQRANMRCVGGLVHAIAKKEGGHRIDQMRGITLIDIVGKMVHSLLRQRFLPGLNLLRQPLQLGGFARQTTLFATQYVRAFASLTAARKLSSAVLFIDIRSAFHMMIREFIFDTTKPIPDKLREILVDAGLDFAAIRDNVVRRESFTAHHVSPSVAHLLADAHDHTWYTLGACDDVHRTERGSRPGSPLADVAYNSLMSLVIRELQTAIDAHPPLQRAFAMLGLSAPIVAWVDDLAVPLTAVHATDMVSMLQWLATTTVRICHTFGLQLNFSPGKTETVVAFRGPGAPACRAQWMVQAQGCIPLPDLSTSLRCVPRYEHLGTTFQPDGGIDAEIRHRCSRATMAYRQVRKPILLNRHLDVRTRLRLFDALVMPVLLHGAGNWPLLTTMQLHHLHALYLRWLRSIVGDGFWAADQRTDLHLLLAWGLPTLTMRLAKARLLHGFHLVRDAPQTVLDFVTAVQAQPFSWMTALRHAVAWYATLSPSFFSGDPLTADCSDVVQWLFDRRFSGPRDVRRLFRLALHQGRTVGDALSHHLELQRCLRKGGIEFVEPTSQSRPCFSFACRWCAKSFATARRLRNHQWCAHGEPSDERRFMTSTTCPACWKHLWTSNRLQIHLRQSRSHPNGCYEQLTWRYTPADVLWDIEELSCDRRFARLPAHVIPHVTSAQEHSLDSREAALRSFQAAWNHEGLPDVFDDTQGDGFFAAFDDVLHALLPGVACDLDALLWHITGIVDCDDHSSRDVRYGAWALSLWTLDRCTYARFPHLGTSGFDRVFRAIRSLVLESPVGRLVCWKRRMDEAFCPSDAHDDEVDQDVADASSALSSRDPEPLPHLLAIQDSLFAPLFEQDFVGNSCLGVPLCSVDGSSTLLILHLFSGRRRIGDCHWWLEHLAAQILPDYPIMLLSVDTAVDGSLGDLSTGPNHDMLLRMAAKGAVAGSLTGPPCETFSAARCLQMDDERAPRPLRTRAHPWCLLERTPRELRQCATGTELLFNSLMLEATVALAGGGCLMEHPEEPQDESKVSVWRLSCHQHWIMRLRGAARHHIEQWLFGAAGVKPTCIRALGLGPPQLVGRIFQENTEPWRVRPMQGLRGRDAQGRFRTAKAKEYPSSLCRTLVLAMLRGLKHRICSEGVAKTKPGAEAKAASKPSWAEKVRGGTQRWQARPKPEVAPQDTPAIESAAPAAEASTEPEDATSEGLQGKVPSWADKVKQSLDK